jgi:hypothetical protein
VPQSRLPHQPLLTLDTTDERQRVQQAKSYYYDEVGEGDEVEDVKKVMFDSNNKEGLSVGSNWSDFDNVIGKGE